MTPDPTAVPFSVPLSYLALGADGRGLLLANARRARRIRRGAPPRRLCDKSGFAECFDALTGAGQRDRAYTWTASIFFLLASEFA